MDGTVGVLALNACSKSLHRLRAYLSSGLMQRVCGPLLRYAVDTRSMKYNTLTSHFSKHSTVVNLPGSTELQLTDLSNTGLVSLACELLTKLWASLLHINVTVMSVCYISSRKSLAIQQNPLIPIQ